MSAVSTFEGGWYLLYFKLIMKFCIYIDDSKTSVSLIEYSVFRFWLVSYTSSLNKSTFLCIRTVFIWVPQWWMLSSFYSIPLLFIFGSNDFRFYLSEIEFIFEYKLYHEFIQYPRHRGSFRLCYLLRVGLVASTNTVALEYSLR